MPVGIDTLAKGVDVLSGAAAGWTSSFFFPWQPTIKVIAAIQRTNLILNECLIRASYILGLARILTAIGW
ncbi:hypothetical protein D3C83_265830 [compost metagenome]